MYNNIQTEADQLGFFGEYGGQFVPETLMPAVLELKQAYNKAKKDPQFQQELNDYLTEYVCRSKPLTFAQSYTQRL
nr:tryptophan synthase subunit beta [Staphylococcus lugdunensis]